MSEEFEFTVEEKDGDSWMQYASGICPSEEEAVKEASHYALHGMRVTVFKREILLQFVK